MNRKIGLRSILLAFLLPCIFLGLLCVKIYAGTTVNWQNLFAPIIMLVSTLGYVYFFGLLIIVSGNSISFSYPFNPFRKTEIFFVKDIVNIKCKITESRWSTNEICLTYKTGNQVNLSFYRTFMQEADMRRLQTLVDKLMPVAIET